jgi:CubicO group peptidase (beta-lactamase class C family)
MHRLVAVTTLFLLIASLSVLIPSCGKQGPEVEKRIARVENGLIEFRSPAAMLEPDSAQLANPRTLTERMAYYKVPGVSIAVINNNEVEWTKAYGIADANTDSPVTTETIFQAASTSKFVTAVLALHLVQKELVHLDEEVNKYLTSWKIPETQFTKEEKPTLRRILSHQAGFPTTNFGHDEKLGYPTLVEVLKGEPPALNEPAVPEFTPGASWQYSNVGYDVIQLLVEDMTGKPFAEVAEKIVFEPLKMKSTTFAYPLDPDRKRREAMPHDEEGISREPSMHLTALAHGGLTTTPADLAELTCDIMLSYQGKSGKTLSKEMARDLFSKQVDIDPRAFGLPLGQGLGVLLMGKDESFAFAHPGYNRPGMACWLMGWPERGVGVVIMANGAKGELLAMEIISAVNSVYLEEASP